jgi:phosphoribosylanthranilate isomerase
MSAPGRTHVKICGLTSPEQALACVEAGASAIGVNLVASSPRRVDIAGARAIARAVGGRALVVGVVANLDVDAMRRLREEAELGCLQLHGDEPPEALVTLLPHAYKVLRIATAEDVARAGAYPGEHVMVDARVSGALGGTGRSFDWSLVVGLARARKLTLAGGLTAENVEAAVRQVGPFAVDVASGVEVPGVPGTKDLERVRSFMAAVARADHVSV